MVMRQAFKEFFDLFNDELESIIEMAMAKKESLVNIFDKHDQRYYEMIVDSLVEKGYKDKLIDDDAFLMSVVKHAFAARYGGPGSQTGNSIPATQAFKNDPASIDTVTVNMTFLMDGKTVKFKLDDIYFDGEQYQQKFEEKGWDVTTLGFGYGGQIQNADGKKKFRPIADYLKKYVETGHGGKPPEVLYNLRQKTAGKGVSAEDIKKAVDLQKGVFKTKDLELLSDKEKAQLMGNRPVMRFELDEEDRKFESSVDDEIDVHHPELSSDDRRLVKAKAMGMRYGNGFFDKNGSVKSNVDGVHGSLTVPYGKNGEIELDNLWVNPSHLLEKIKAHSKSRNFLEEPLFDPSMDQREKTVSARTLDRLMNQGFYQIGHAQVGGHSNRNDQYGGFDGILAKDWALWKKRKDGQKTVEAPPIEDKELAKMATWRHGNTIVENPNSTIKPNSDDDLQSWVDVIMKDASKAYNSIKNTDRNINSRTFKEMSRDDLETTAITTLMMSKTGDQMFRSQEYRISQLASAMQGIVDEKKKEASGGSLDQELGSDGGMSAKDMLKSTDRGRTDQRGEYEDVPLHLHGRLARQKAKEEELAAKSKQPDEVPSFRDEISKAEEKGEDWSTKRNQISQDDLEDAMKGSSEAKPVQALVPPPSFRQAEREPGSLFIRPGKKPTSSWLTLSTEQKRKAMDLAMSRGWDGTWEDDGTRQSKPVERNSGKGKKKGPKYNPNTPGLF